MCSAIKSSKLCMHTLNSRLYWNYPSYTENLLRFSCLITGSYLASLTLLLWRMPAMPGSTLPLGGSLGHRSTSSTGFRSRMPPTTVGRSGSSSSTSWWRRPPWTGLSYSSTNPLTFFNDWVSIPILQIKLMNICWVKQCCYCTYH